eukprot:gene12124-8346_t
MWERECTHYYFISVCPPRGPLRPFFVCLFKNTLNIFHIFLRFFHHEFLLHTIDHLFVLVVRNNLLFLSVFIFIFICLFFAHTLYTIQLSPTAPFYLFIFLLLSSFTPFFFFEVTSITRSVLSLAIINIILCSWPAMPSLESLALICHFHHVAQQQTRGPVAQGSGPMPLAFIAAHPMTRAAAEWSSGGYDVLPGLRIQLLLGPDDRRRHDAHMHRLFRIAQRQEQAVCGGHDGAAAVAIVPRAPSRGAPARLAATGTTTTASPRRRSQRPKSCILRSMRDRSQQLQQSSGGGGAEALLAAYSTTSSGAEEPLHPSPRPASPAPVPPSSASQGVGRIFSTRRSASGRAASHRAVSVPLTSTSRSPHSHRSDSSSSSSSSSRRELMYADAADGGSTWCAATAAQWKRNRLRDGAGGGDVRHYPDIAATVDDPETFPRRRVRVDRSERLGSVMWWLTRIPVVPMQLEVVPDAAPRGAAGVCRTPGRHHHCATTPRQQQSSATSSSRPPVPRSAVSLPTAPSRHPATTLSLPYRGLSTLLQSLDIQHHEPNAARITEIRLLYQRLHRLHAISVVGSALREGRNSTPLDFLQSCTQLRYVFLDGCLGVRSADTLRSCPLLTVVSARGTGLVSIDWMRYCSRIEEVYLDRSASLQRLDVLAKLPCLRVLHLAELRTLGNRDVQLWLSECVGLEELNLRGCCGVTDLHPLERLGRLRVLSAGELPALKELPSPSQRPLWPDLAALNLDGCRSLVNVDGLHQSEVLRHVDLSRTAVRSLAWLATGCSDALETLSLTDCKEIVDWQPLCRAHHLRRVTAKGAVVSTIAWLSSCPLLQSVELDNAVLRPRQEVPHVAASAVSRRLGSNPGAVEGGVEEEEGPFQRPAGVQHDGQRRGAAATPQGVPPLPLEENGVEDPLLAVLPEREQTWDAAAPARPLQPAAGMVLSGLHTLTISDCEVVSVDWIAGCPALRHLSLSGCSAVSDLSPLGLLRHLRVLHADLTRVQDLAWVSHCCYLKELRLRGCRAVSDVAELALLPRLRVLDLSHSPVADLRPLEGHAALQTLLLRGCKALQSFDVIATLPQLETLDVSRTAVRSLDRWLPQCSRLLELDISDCPAVKSLDGVAQLPRLRVLSARRMRLADLSWLKGCGALRRLHIAGSELPEGGVRWGLYLPLQTSSHAHPCNTQRSAAGGGGGGVKQYADMQVNRAPFDALHYPTSFLSPVFCIIIIIIIIIYCGHCASSDTLISCYLHPNFRLFKGPSKTQFSGVAFVIIIIIISIISLLLATDYATMGGFLRTSFFLLLLLFICLFDLFFPLSAPLNMSPLALLPNVVSDLLKLFFSFSFFFCLLSLWRLLILSRCSGVLNNRSAFEHLNRARNRIVRFYSNISYAFKKKRQNIE